MQGMEIEEGSRRVDVVKPNIEEEEERIAL